MVRAELKPEQALAIVERLKEPYSTMVLLVASLGRRIEEAMGLQPGDLNENNVLHSGVWFMGGSGGAGKGTVASAAS